MKSLTTLLLVFAAATLFANDGNNTYKNLLQVNKEWTKQPDAQAVLQSYVGAPKNFNEWIATHLMLVEKTLRSRNTTGLNKSQKQNRAKMLDELHHYWQVGIFPINDYLTYKNPVFIDRYGTHCAVGYLMLKSGHGDLAKRIDANEKFAYVRQIKTEGVAQWATEFGFTVDELAWIQPGYPASMPTYDLDGGVNGVVNVIVADTVSGIVYAGGSFSHTTNGVACNNIAAWISGFAGWSWIALGTGVNGDVHTLLHNNGKLYVGGNFTQAGGVNAKNIAVYDVSTGQWSAMGQLDSTVQALAIYNGDVFAGGKFTGFISKWNGTGWTDVGQGYLYGEGVRTLEVWNNLLAIGGNFELATGALRQHVATYDGTYIGMLGMGTLTPVNDLQMYRGKLYAACDVAAVCAIAKFDESDWVVHLKNDTAQIWESVFNGNKVNTLQVRDSTLLIGGDFSCSTGGGISYSGSHLMQYNDSLNYGSTTIYDVYAPMLTLDAPVHTLQMSPDGLYFGGQFINQQNMVSGTTLNRIAKVFGSGFTGMPTDNQFTFSYYPNPTTGWVNIQLPYGAKDARMYITDLQGRKVLQQPLYQSVNTVSIQSLQAGVYVLGLTTSQGQSSARLVIE
ncbi:MAG: T9SS type A sorting domain-containing protein [Chitinophagales bacterium]|nr:T9SS type A sorting domain-containing protein [Chitinophagales bacterium]